MGMHPSIEDTKHRMVVVPDLVESWKEATAGNTRSVQLDSNLILPWQSPGSNSLNLLGNWPHFYDPIRVVIPL
jgi:hypothetical protein